MSTYLWLALSFCVVAAGAFGLFRAYRARESLLLGDWSIRPRKGAYSEFLSNRLGDGARLPNVGIGTTQKNASTPKKRSPKEVTRQSAVEAAVQTTISGAIIADSWRGIDPHVLQAFEALGGPQGPAITSFWDLSKVVEAKGYPLDGSFWERTLPGHVAEQHVAQHLQAAGHQVTFPSTANNPGWDLNVDGHLVNVKNYADLHGLSAHFNHYPNVPVIAPFDAAHVPAHAINFAPGEHLSDAALTGHHQLIIDHGLAHADSAHALAGPHDLIQHHGLAQHGLHGHAFPIGAMIVSSYREGKLLLSGATDPVRAAMNVGIDVVATGTGAKAGALAGGAIGVHFGGIGAIPGALIGAVVGGISGRMGAGFLRTMPLRRAWENYEAANASYQRAEAALMAEIEPVWQKWVKSVEKSYKRALQAVSADASKDVRSADRAAHRTLSLTADEARLLADAAHLRLIDYLAEAKVSEAGRSSIEFKRSIERQAAQWDKRLSKLVKRWRPTSRRTEKLYDLLCSLPSAEDLLAERLGAVSRVRAEGRATVVEIGSKMDQVCTGLRATAVRALNAKYFELTDYVGVELAPLGDALSDAVNLYRAELARAGHV